MGELAYSATPIVGLAGGSLILVVVLVLLVFGVAYGLFTRKGSGINQHPVADSKDPVLGDETKFKKSDDPEDEQAAVIDRTEGSVTDQRGVK